MLSIDNVRMVWSSSKPLDGATMYCKLLFCAKAAGRNINFSEWLQTLKKFLKNNRVRLVLVAESSTGLKVFRYLHLSICRCIEDLDQSNRSVLELLVLLTIKLFSAT